MFLKYAYLLCMLKLVNVLYRFSGTCISENLLDYEHPIIKTDLETEVGSLFFLNNYLLSIIIDYNYAISITRSLVVTQLLKNCVFLFQCNACLSFSIIFF